jgi:protein O-mannosyl-transferase
MSQPQTPLSSSAGRQSTQNVAMPRRFSSPLAVAGIFMACLVAYLPSLHGGFILDDDLLLTENLLIKAPDGLFRFWCTTEPTDYWPVSNSSLWMEWRLWGNHPTGYHFTNLILHFLGCVLLWAVLRKLSIPGALLAAVLFAVHPVNVESVAWIAQRKNLLALLFSLLSVWSYRQARIEVSTSSVQSQRGNRLWYWLSVTWFLLAMLSKGSVAILPLLLLVIAWWQSGGVDRRELWRTAPFFAIAIVLTLVNLWFRSHGAETEIREVTFIQRVLGAGAVVWFYLWKAVWPFDLSFIYPQWNIEPNAFRWWLPLLATAAFTVALIWKRRTKSGRAMLFAWAIFCLGLLPVMGFTDVGFMKHSLVADHYQHLPLIAVIALFAAALTTWRQSAPPARRGTILAIAAGIVVVLTVSSWRRSSLFADTEALYVDTLAKNPDSWLAQNNLGNALMERGDYAAAAPYFREAMRLKPDDARIHNNLAITLAAQGQTDDAIDQIEQALNLNPNYPEAHYNLAIALGDLGRLPEAIAHYQATVRLKPDLLPAYLRLADCEFQSGRIADAIQSAERGLDLARVNGQTDLATEIEARLRVYRARSTNGPAPVPRPAPTPP